MTTNPHNPDVAHLDADLHPLAAALDQLGAADRSALDGIEDRLFQSTLAPLHGVQPVAAQVAELGALDRARAPRGLEEEVFDATVPALRETAAPRLVLHPATADRSPRTHARIAWWNRAPVRIAAVLTLVAGTTFAIRSSLTPPHRPDRPTGTYAGEMDALFAAAESQSGTGGVDHDDSSADFDPDKLSQWLSEGAAS